MTTATPITRAPVSTATSTGLLYLIRAVIAIIWAGLLTAAVFSNGAFTPQESIPAFAVTLLISYPLIDVVASLIDARTARHGAPRNATAQLINAAVSAAAAVAIAIAASHGADAVLRVFGAWALLTGLIQLILAIIRRRRGTAGQLPMILSGSISTVAGIAFILMATKSELNLINLAVYAAAGAIFFLVSARRLRSQRGVVETRTGTRDDA